MGWAFLALPLDRLCHIFPLLPKQQKGNLPVNDTRVTNTMRILIHSSPNLQSSSIRWAPGLVKFVPAVAYLFCLNLPAAFSQPGARHIGEPCILVAEAHHVILLQKQASTSVILSVSLSLSPSPSPPFSEKQTAVAAGEIDWKWGLAVSCACVR